MFKHIIDCVQLYFKWSSFWSWRVCNQAKLSHLGPRKPAHIHWKADAPKTSQCLVRLLVQRHNWIIFLRKIARSGRYSRWWPLFGHVERIFVHNIWFQQEGGTCHTAEATLDVLRPVFEDRVISRRTDVVWPSRSCDWHRWIMICRLPSKTSVTPRSQRQLTL